MNTRLEARFFGRVQGVGFRFSTLRISRGYSVSGHVRNSEDGSVELVAEGEREDLEGFLKAIHRKLGHTIENTETVWSTAENRLGPFRIAF